MQFTNYDNLQPQQQQKDTNLFGVGDKLFELVVQGLKEAFPLFILSLEARQNQAEEWLVAQ